MEFVVRALRGWAVPLVMPISRAALVFDGAGRVTDPAIEAQLHTLGQEVVRAARQFAELGHCDYE
jgi:FMN reductase